MGPCLEAPALLLVRDRKPVLEELDAGPHQHALEFRHLAHELEVLDRIAEPHDALDARPVVPGAIEEHHVAPCGQMLHIALEVPLAHFVLGRLFERDDAGGARVQVFHEPLDSASLACRIAPFEQDDDLLAGGLDPVLHFQQFDLQVFLVPVVHATPDLGLVWIPALTEQFLDLFGAVAQLSETMRRIHFFVVILVCPPDVHRRATRTCFGIRHVPFTWVKTSSVFYLYITH